MMVVFEYTPADFAGGYESELRVLRLDDETGEYLPVGTDDHGDSAWESPTEHAQHLDGPGGGDHGINSSTKEVWAQVEHTKTDEFRVGIPERETLPETIDTGDTGRGCGTCGAFGMVCLPMTVLSMMAMRRRRR